jgi:hypothetical protein
MRKSILIVTITTTVVSSTDLVLLHNPMRFTNFLDLIQGNDHPLRITLLLRGDAAVGGGTDTFGSQSERGRHTCVTEI